jgi:hypothetical protein
MVDQNMLGRAEKYLELYNAIKAKTSGDDRLALTVLQEVTKDRRMDEMREEREQRNGEPATPKQLQFLKKLGVEVRPGITKREASMRIDEALMKED